MANLSFKNINKIYNNNVQAVFNFDLEVKDKEFIVFVGPSGCGKSTTLRMVAGLEDISSGELFIDGQLVNNILPKDRDIAMVFQSYALYPHMTVFDNMAFALKLRKSKKPIYEEDEEIEKVRKENYAYLKEIKKIDRKLKNKKVDEVLLANKEGLFNKILANEDYIVTIQKQKIGISNLDIKELSALIDTTLYELKKIQPKIQYKCVQIENLTQRIEKEKNSNVVKLKAKIDVLNEQIRKLEELKIQKQNYLEKNESELEYFKNNEVPLYSLRKHNKYEIYVEVYKTAKILDLTKYIFRKPAALSGGQRQRVALGRAIVRHPKVFLMDEPLSNLDAKLRVQMRSEISKIHEAVGATTIYVTHDQTEAMTMASRIVVMKDGYIQQIGTPSEVYSDPANMFVGGFIGSPSMNFIEGHVEKGSFVINGENPIIIKLSNSDKELLNDVEENIYLGVRPEHIYLNGDVNNTSPTNTLNINCDYAELLGNEFVVYTYLNGQKLVLKVLTKSQIKTHDNIDIAFAKDLLYFFKKDGTRIKKH